MVSFTHFPCKDLESSNWKNPLKSGFGVPGRYHLYTYNHNITRHAYKRLYKHPFKYPTPRFWHHHGDPTDFGKLGKHPRLKVVLAGMRISLVGGWVTTPLENMIVKNGFESSPKRVRNSKKSIWVATTCRYVIRLVFIYSWFLRSSILEDSAALERRETRPAVHLDILSEKWGNPKASKHQTWGGMTGPQKNIASKHRNLSRYMAGRLQEESTWFRMFERMGCLEVTKPSSIFLEVLKCLYSPEN